MSQTTTRPPARINDVPEVWDTPPGMVEARLDEIENALKFDPYHPYRQELVREYLAIIERKDHEKAA